MPKATMRNRIQRPSANSQEMKNVTNELSFDSKRISNFADFEYQNSKEDYIHHGEDDEEVNEYRIDQCSKSEESEQQSVLNNCDSNK